MREWRTFLRYLLFTMWLQRQEALLKGVSTSKREREREKNPERFSIPPIQID